MLKKVIEKINNELKKSFKTKWDFIRIAICQVFVLIAIFIFKSFFLILIVLAIYILIEYLIDQKNKADKTDDII